MKAITLTFLAAISLFTTNEITAQVKKSNVVYKTSKKTPTKNQSTDSREITIAEINARMHAINEDAQQAVVSKETKPQKYCYMTEQLVNVANDYQGTRYAWGGMTRNGMDCSGFVKTAFEQFNINLPRTSREMASLGKKVTKSSAQTGDLIFFKNEGKKMINHVGIVVEASEDEIKFIHSSTSQGVIISSTKEPYYSKGFAQINRVYEQQIL